MPMKSKKSLTYQDCLQAMYRLHRFGIKLGLDTIGSILTGLNNPQRQYACIHIAGTNGKGSVAAYLGSILQQAGYRVGVYTSPHLIRFNERIVVNQQPISDEAIVNAYLAVKNVQYGDREPTFFEYTTAMALYEFARQQVAWAVIETGMGGRMDATNVIQPVVSVITNISLEHRSYLGNTIAEIAGEKGGIIKYEIPVVTAVSQPSAITVLEMLAAKQSAPLYRLKKDFRVRRNPDHSFSYSGLENIWKNMRTGLPGAHQISNAALALAACEILNRNHTHISLMQIQEGLEQTCWPGRLEVVSRAPMIILDGAHNLDASRKLAHYLATDLKGRKITLVIGILSDKPYEAILKNLISVCSRVILTCPEIDRALPIEILYQKAALLTDNIEQIKDVGRAVDFAISTSAPDDVICVAGSLYVVGEAKAALSHVTEGVQHM